MVDVSDRYFLFLMRLMSRHSTLYTPMISAHNLLRGKKGAKDELGYMNCQNPVVC